MSSDDTPATGGFEAWKRAVGEAFADGDRARVTVYVRSTLPPLGAKSRQERVLDRLDALADRGVVDEVELLVTGDRLCLCDTCTDVAGGSELLDRIERLREWRGPADATATPYFERRTVLSNIADESAHAIVPPRVAVALSIDDSLAGVFPCRIGAEHYAVEDFLDALSTLPVAELPVAEP